MSYKLLKELQDKFEMQHPSGESFVIAKKGLNKKVLEHIKSLGKGYADGGVVEQEFINPSFSMPEELANKEEDITKPVMFTGVPGILGNPEANIRMGQNNTIQQPIMQQPATPETTDAPPIVNRSPQAQEVISNTIPEQSTNSAIMGSGYNQAMSGISGTAKVQEDLYKEQAAVMKQHEQDQVKVDELHNKNLGNLLKDAEKFGDAANQDVNPNRYWGSLSTGNKISASIGLILGGIGAGMVKGENQALKVIDSAINNDIESQKVNASKNMNMYRQAMDKYKDERVAHNEVKLAQLAIVDSKLKQAELNAKSKDAKFAAQQARGELQMKYAPLIDEQAKKKTQLEIMRMANANPEAITSAMVQYLPKEQQDRFVPGAGFALTAEGAKKIREEYKPDHDDAIAALDRLVQLREKYGSEIYNREAVAEADTLKGILKGKLRTFLVGPGAVTENEQKTLDNIIQDPTSLTSGDKSVYKRLETLRGAISASYANKARLNGLEMNAQAQQKPQTPNIMVNKKTGVPMQKVNGGWTTLKTGK